MSRESSVLRGITNADLKQTVSKALQAGWELSEFTGTTHVYIVWPKTNERVSIATTTSDRNSYKNVARKIEKISGVEVIPKHRHRRSRKVVKATDYSTETSRKEINQWHREWGGRVQELITERRELVEEFKSIASSGEGANRTQINRAAEIIKRMTKLDETLAEFNQPVDPFDPFDI
jgi:hypothetical protein